MPRFHLLFLFHMCISVVLVVQCTAMTKRHTHVRGEKHMECQQLHEVLAVTTEPYVRSMSRIDLSSAEGCCCFSHVGQRCLMICRGGWMILCMCHWVWMSRCLLGCSTATWWCLQSASWQCCVAKYVSISKSEPTSHAVSVLLKAQCMHLSDVCCISYAVYTTSVFNVYNVGKAKCNSIRLPVTDCAVHSSCHT